MGPGDPFNPSGIFDSFPKPPPTPKPKPALEKGLPWRAKEINGKLYLPIEQVCELLEQNNVLPAVRRGLEKHFKKE